MEFSEYHAWFIVLCRQKMVHLEITILSAINYYYLSMDKPPPYPWEDSYVCTEHCDEITYLNDKVPSIDVGEDFVHDLDTLRIGNHEVILACNVKILQNKWEENVTPTVGCLKVGQFCQLKLCFSAQKCGRVFFAYKTFSTFYKT